MDNTQERIACSFFSPADRDVFKAYLEHEGFAVDMFDTGTALLHHLAHTDARVDAIVADYRLKGVWGAAIYKRARAMERYRYTPIMILLERKKFRISLVDDQNGAFIDKEVAPSEILETVKRIIREHNQATRTQ